MILHVVEATYEHDYVVRLKFNDGAEGFVDLADELYGEMFAPLKDKAKFATLRLDPELSTALFRILQEALTNVLRHARASRVYVRLFRSDEAVTLSVRDNGVGIATARITDSKSVGLTGMRERVLPWDGKVTISGKAGKGTEITITVPVRL